MLKKYFLQILVILLLILIAWTLFPKNKEQNLQPASVLKLPINDNSVQNYYPIRNWSVNEPDVLAKSALVLNYYPGAKNNILYQKNIFQPMPIASITKLMTAIIALENYNQEDIIKSSKNEEELTVKDLLYLMLVESNNDAATILAANNPQLEYNQFIELMNNKAQEMNLKNTSFVESVGLSACNQSTALEIAEIAKHALEFPLLTQIIGTPETTIISVDKRFIHKITNTNKLLGKIPELIGGKTGYTDEAGECMVTISKILENNYLITVVLGSSERENDMEKLIAWSKNAFLW